MALPSPTELEQAPRCISATQAAAIVAGNMIGVGIFLLPAQVASHAPTTGSFLLVWALGGAWALCGALCLGELGAMLPRAGGDYAFLREAYGRDLACTYGWLSLLITFPGSLAVMASLTMQYQAPTLFGDWMSTQLLQPGDGSWSVRASQGVAVLVLALLTALNHRTTRGSAWSQVAVTAVPLAMLLVGAAGLVTLSRASAPVPVEVTGQPGLGALGLAMLPVYFAYAGWNAAAYVGGEIKHPARNLPRALLLGTGAVTALYLLVCLAYTRVVPVQDMPGTFSVGAAAAHALLGETGGFAVDALIVIAVLGSLNATILTGSRVVYALSVDGLFPRWAANLHPRWRTPARSLWIQCALASAFILYGDVEPVLDVTVSAMVLMSMLTVGALPVLRVRRPDTPRLFRVPLYPLLPAAYIVIGGVALWASMLHSPWRGGMGLGLAGLIWLARHVYARQRVPRDATPAGPTSRTF